MLCGLKLGISLASSLCDALSMSPYLARSLLPASLRATFAGALLSAKIFEVAKLVTERIQVRMRAGDEFTFNGGWFGGIKEVFTQFMAE